MIRLALGQVSDPTPEWLDYGVQIGCTGAIVHVPAIPHDDGYWTVDDLVRLKERVESRGLELVSLENTSWDMYEDCMVAGPRRDEQLENYCRTIRNMGQAGIPTLGFCWMPNGVWSSGFDHPGRGGSRVRLYDHRDHENAPLTHGRRIEADEMWDNFRHFMRTVVPAAEEAGVRLALHPDDPPVPELGGIARILWGLEAFQQATEEFDSPAFGLNFCMGSWSEVGPGVAMQAMRYFAERQKIFYVHFRDVKGHVPYFEECFLGEGNIDPVEPLRILMENGFDGYVQDDHVPVLQDDPNLWGHRGRAWAAGYISGLLRALQGPPAELRR